MPHTTITSALLYGKATNRNARPESTRSLGKAARYESTLLRGATAEALQADHGITTASHLDLENLTIGDIDGGLDFLLFPIDGDGEGEYGDDPGYGDYGDDGFTHSWLETVTGESEITLAESDVASPVNVFTVRRTGDLSEELPFSVNFFDSSATYGADFSIANTSSTFFGIFGMGESSFTITFESIPADLQYEGAETIVADYLASNNGYEDPENPPATDGDGNPNVAYARITDFERLELSIGDVAVEEGELAVFTITLNYPYWEDITLDYAMSNGTAFGGEDYEASADIVTIPAGETSATIYSTAIEDEYFEEDEIFYVTISCTLPEVTVVRDQAEGTIFNDDTDKPFWIEPYSYDSDFNGVTLREAETGTDVPAFVIKRSTSGPARTVYLSYAGAATAGTEFDGDYWNYPTTVEFGANDTSVTVYLQPRDDEDFEGGPGSYEDILAILEPGSDYSVGYPGGLTPETDPDGDAGTAMARIEDNEEPTVDIDGDSNADGTIDLENPGSDDYIEDNPENALSVMNGEFEEVLLTSNISDLGDYSEFTFQLIDEQDFYGNFNIYDDTNDSHEIELDVIWTYEEMPEAIFVKAVNENINGRLSLLILRNGSEIKRDTIQFVAKTGVLSDLVWQTHQGNTAIDANPNWVSTDESVMPSRGINGVEGGLMGKRIFTDQLLADAKNGADNPERRKVDFSVSVKDSLGSPLPNTPVYFVMWDIDDIYKVDATIYEGLDSNYTGGDNNDPQFILFQNKPITFTLKSDAMGIVKGTYEKLSTYAGDNYMLTASLRKQDVFQGKGAADTTIKQTEIDSYLEHYGDENNQLRNGIIASEPLTVWRKLYVEVDSIDDVQENQVLRADIELESFDMTNGVVNELLVVNYFQGDDYSFNLDDDVDIDGLPLEDLYNGPFENGNIYLGNYGAPMNSTGSFISGNGYHRITNMTETGFLLYANFKIPDNFEDHVNRIVKYEKPSVLQPGTFTFEDNVPQGANEVNIGRGTYAFTRMPNDPKTIRIHQNNVFKYVLTIKDDDKPYVPTAPDISWAKHAFAAAYIDVTSEGLNYNKNVAGNFGPSNTLDVGSIAFYRNIGINVADVPDGQWGAIHHMTSTTQDLLNKKSFNNADLASSGFWVTQVLAAYESPMYKLLQDGDDDLENSLFGRTRMNNDINIPTRIAEIYMETIRDAKESIPVPHPVSDVVKQTVAHELGHAMGLENHTSNLMEEGYSGITHIVLAKEFNSAEIAFFRKSVKGTLR